MCSGNCSGAPRWPIEKSVRLNVAALRALLQLLLERACRHVVDQEERARAELHALAAVAGVLGAIGQRQAGRQGGRRGRASWNRVLRMGNSSVEWIAAFSRGAHASVNP